MRPLEQEYSGHAEGESYLKRMGPRRELQKSSREPTIAVAMGSGVREARM